MISRVGSDAAGEISRDESNSRRGNRLLKLINIARIRALKQMISVLFRGIVQRTCTEEFQSPKSQSKSRTFCKELPLNCRKPKGIHMLASLFSAQHILWALHLFQNSSFLGLNTVT